MKCLHKYSCSLGLILLSAVLLEGCATTGASNASTTLVNNSKTDLATTYGLVSNQAPADLPGPAVNTQAFQPPADNALTAPANLVLLFGAQNQLSAHDQQALLNQANYLVVHPDMDVQLNGYADANGSQNVNVLLSWQLLQQIKQQLLQYGVAPKQIEMVSYGKGKPLVDGYGNTALQYNRRVQLVYEVKQNEKQ